jgi:hypothetical protein
MPPFRGQRRLPSHSHRSVSSVPAPGRWCAAGALSFAISRANVGGPRAPLKGLGRPRWNLTLPQGLPRSPFCTLLSASQKDETSHLRGFREIVTLRPPFDRRWAAVPADLGRRKDRAQAFARSWERWLGPTELLFTQRTETGKTALAAASAQAPDHDARARRIWV